MCWRENNESPMAISKMDIVAHHNSEYNLVKEPRRIVKRNEEFVFSK